MDQKKRSHIMKTAMKLFIENGFHNTPTSKIAKEAGVAVGTLFNYFPTKEDLIIETYKEIKKESKQTFFDGFELNTDLKSIMRHIFTNYILWGISNPIEYRFTRMFKHSPFMRMCQDDEMNLMFQRFKDKLNQYSEIRESAKVNPKFSLTYIYEIMALTTDYIVLNKVEDKDQIINTAFDLFWNGFAS